MEQANNSALVGGAICSERNTTLTFSGIIYLTKNGEVNTFNGYTIGGGGVYLGLNLLSPFYPTPLCIGRTILHVLEELSMLLMRALQVTVLQLLHAYIPQEECFFQLPGQNLFNGIDVNFVFKNNFAGGAGSVLYGDAIDNCILTHGLDSHSSGKVFDMIVQNNDTDYNTTSTISSDPLHICYCENSLLDCSASLYHFPRTAYPGETFQVSVVTVTSHILNNCNMQTTPAPN